MRMLVAIAPVLAVVCMSCAGGGDEIARPEVVQSADIVREDDGVTSRYFGVDNPYTLQRIAEVHEEETVRSTTDGFEELGYAYEPRQSFVAEGTGPAGEPLEIAALAMTGPAGRDASLVYVLVIRSAKEAYVVPLKCSFTDAPADDEALQISDGVWMALAGEPVGYAVGAGPGLSSARLSWRAWFRCLVERIVSGAASCAWSCQFTSGLYLPCLAQCTAGYAIYALFSCSFQAM